MSPVAGTRAILGVSLKLYLSVAQTREWLTGLAGLALSGQWAEHLELFVCPDVLLIDAALTILDEVGVGVGAQDVFWEARGPYTGEVSPASVAELGGSFAEIGHAERRRLFGERDVDVAAKVAAAVAHELTPVVCIGESKRGTPEEAVAFCRPQVTAALGGRLNDHARLIFAYEPVWAIGADAPADPEHICAVLAGVRQVAGGADGVRWIYGGTAGRDLYGELVGAADGLFLGRAAHDLSNLARIADEMIAGQSDT